MRQKSQGFTLLELLVSMSIFATLGLGAYQMLQTVADSHERVRSSADAFTRLNLAYSIIQRDFNQFAPRVVRDEYGEVLPTIDFENEDYIIEFTRRGWRNPAGRQRSRLQRVAYSLDFEEETLTRHFWEVLDRAEDSEPVSQLLLEGVTDFRVTGFSGDESATDIDFILEDQKVATPLAMEVVISTNALGESYRLFQMVEPYLASSDGETRDRNDTSSGNPANPDAQDER
ncbi:type II secretion system minor pseudopilin GspJ [Gammaproteobacteria bacterium]|nr:type II secretion system minor pseudopilin GspJ [Gammaproteobacteria bacterium]